MSIFNSLILNVIYIVFPLLCYLFYVSYKESFSKKCNHIFLEIALFTSVYLCVKFGNTYIILFNIPLLLSYLKERKSCSAILSFLISYYSITKLNFNLGYVILEYSTYYIMFSICRKNKLYKRIFPVVFTIITLAFNVIYNINDLNNLYINIVLLPIITYTIIKLINKAESIVSIHTTIKTNEEYKQIRESLFKITHEIKNPIAVCKGYLDMFDKNNPKHVEKFIPIVKNEINRTLTIMNDFMEFSKIKLELDIMDIEMLLEEVLDSLSNLINAKEIKLSYEIRDEEIFINGDYNRLKQVFINLFKNSIEALENISKAKIEMDYQINDKNIIISIKDNGVGMDDETLKNIYDAFYTTKKNGTGLGVSISREIIEGHHGKIEYSSIINEGTNVKITLPITNL